MLRSGSGCCGINASHFSSNEEINRRTTQLCDSAIVRSSKNIMHGAIDMGWLLNMRKTNLAILVISAFMVFGIVACSGGETVIIVQSDSSDDSASVSTSSSDVSLGDIACNIVSLDEIISVVGVGNEEQGVLSTGAVNGDNLHCGWNSNGSRNIPNRTNLSLPAAHVTVTMMPITAPGTMDNHKLVEGFSLDNDPDAALPEYGKGAFRTGFGSLMRISGDYVVEVTVVMDMTDEDLAAAKALSELVDSRLTE